MQKIFTTNSERADKVIALERKERHYQNISQKKILREGRFVYESEKEEHGNWPTYACANVKVTLTTCCSACSCLVFPRQETKVRSAKIIFFAFVSFRLQ